MSTKQLCFYQTFVNYVIKNAVINVREKKAIESLSKIDIKKIRLICYKEKNRYLKNIQNINYIKHQINNKIYSR